jgi:hypothetical protein
MQTQIRIGKTIQIKDKIIHKFVDAWMVLKILVNTVITVQEWVNFLILLIKFVNVINQPFIELKLVLV